MFKNYLKIALRNLWRRKFYSSMNILGLSLGLAACMIIVFYVKHEFTFDSYHDHADRIVRITTRFETPEHPVSVALSPVLLAPYLTQNYAEVEKVARFQPAQIVVKHGQSVQSEKDTYFSEQSAFDIFSFQFLKGTENGALVRPNTAVINRTLAEKYFHKTDVVGKSILINKVFYEITAVIADVPTNSDMRISALLSRDFQDTKDWLTEDFPVYTFALFKKRPDLKAFEKKLSVLSQSRIQPEFKAMGAEGYMLIFDTELLKDIHYGQNKMGDTPKGNKQYAYLFSFLALAVLGIGILNYINLLTASATERSREVGIRKANGAKRTQLILQFLFESFAISCISIAVAYMIINLSMPVLNSLLAIEIPLDWTSIAILSGICLLVVAFLGGLYPAFVLSAFKPIDALKGSMMPNGQSVWLRKGITFFQFSLVVAMVFGVLVIRRQMKFLQSHSPGFDKEQVLTVSAPADSAARNKMVAFAASLRQESVVQSVTAGTDVMQSDATYPSGTTIFNVNGKKREVISNYFFVDEHFIPTLNVKLLQGRNLKSDNPSDKNGGFIVNEAFVKMSGWKNPVGQSIDGFFHKGEVIGVVKDFNYISLHNKVEPLVMVYNTFPAAAVMVKIKPENLAAVEDRWKSFYPDFPFEYQFLDTAFQNQYRQDYVMITLFNAFVFLTITVACLGLLSLMAFSTNLRIKEIGIRKVLGASVSDVVVTLSGEYILLVGLAVLVACPFAWYAMNKWLQNFAYRVEISWWLFPSAGAIGITIALVTISYQSIKAALMNPVKALRSE